MQIGIKLYSGYLNAPYLWHTNQKTSELIATLEWRHNIGLFLFNMLQVSSQFTVIFILSICICIVAPINSIIIMSVAVICTLYIFKYSKKFIRIFSQKTVDAKHESYKIIHCGLNCIRDIIIYQQHKKFIQNFAKSEKKYSINQSKLPIFPPLPSWILEFIGMFILLITAVLLYWKNDSITSISAILALFAAVAWRLLPVINRIIQNIISMQQQAPALKNIINMISQVEHIDSTLYNINTIYPFNKELRLEHIYFKYHSSLNKHEILRDINISIYKGSIIGFIGLSGAGKSTLVNTIIGLYPPSKGKIIVDDQEIDETNRAAWMRSIGYVPQNPIMLNASLAENIAFSHWGETIDRERVIECCKLAAIDFLDDLEHGIDTILGERSVRLSGGQLQRVSIARALYTNPQIIIFDEATSALDNTHEHLIYNLIYSLKGRITIIIISHKLSTLKKCDYIYQIDNGRIINKYNPRKLIDHIHIK